MKLILFSLLMSLVPMPALAQSGTRQSGTAPASRSGNAGQVPPADVSQEVTLPPEMRARMARERADSEHRKLLDYVEQLSRLSEEVVSSFRENGRLSSGDFKKVRDIEKLAKRILIHAGGKETGDDGIKKDLSLGEALERVSLASADIKKHVTEETRYVVSANVIASSNELIELVQLIKRADK